MPGKTTKTDEGDIQIAVRLAPDLVSKLDAEVDRLTRELGMKITRANVVRMIISKHFEVRVDARSGRKGRR